MLTASRAARRRERERWQLRTFRFCLREMRYRSFSGSTESPYSEAVVTLLASYGGFFSHTAHSRRFRQQKRRRFLLSNMVLTSPRAVSLFLAFNTDFYQRRRIAIVGRTEVVQSALNYLYPSQVPWKALIFEPCAIPFETKFQKGANFVF